MSEATTPSEQPRAFAEERRESILALVREQGRVRVNDLAPLLGVREPTIRRDIAEMDALNLLRRTHGGAMALSRSHEVDESLRVSSNSTAKRRIAAFCVGEMSHGEAVFIDSGTTCLAVVQHLAELNETPPEQRAEVPPLSVKIVTNSLPIAKVAANLVGVRHTVLGGQYRPAGQSFVGTLAVDALQRFNFDIAFVGVTGIAGEDFTVADETEAAIKQAAFARARRRVVVMDSSKIGDRGFVQLCLLEDITDLVVDAATPKLEAACALTGVALHVAG